MSTISLPIEYAKLKAAVRLGLTAEDRPIWWPNLPRIQERQTIESLENVDEIADRLFQMISVSNSNAENTDIIKLLFQTNRIKVPELYVTFLSLYSKVVTKKETQYLTLCELSSNSDKYFPDSIYGHQRRMHVFREVLRMYMPATFSVLFEINGLDFQFLELIFKDFFVEILPRQVVDRVVECYLLEGYKILVRYGLALLASYKRMIKSGVMKTGADFWNKVKRDARANTTPSFWARVHDLAFDLDRSILLRARRPMQIGRLKLKELFVNKTRLPDEFVNEDSITHEKVATSLDTNALRSFQSISSNSHLLDKSNCEYLVRHCLPSIVQNEEFVLAFSTKNDGWDISSLLYHTEDLSPCVIVVKAIKSKALIGFYVHDKISPPNNQIRGDGRTVCFRLDDGKQVVHRWSGNSHHQRHQQSQNMVESVTLHQFVSSSSQHITVGGSKLHGTNAIRLDEDLRLCSTGPSDTFGNDDPLIAVNEESSPFPVSDIEVFVGNQSFLKAVNQGKFERKMSILD